jgi:VRR-NUC domain
MTSSPPRRAAVSGFAPVAPPPSPSVVVAARPGPAEESPAPFDAGPGSPSSRTPVHPPGGRAGSDPGASGAGEVPLAPGQRLIAAKMSEAELDGHVRSIAADLRLMRYHTHDSRRSPAGFPDLVFAGRWVMFRELKTEKGKLSEAQKEWLHALGLAGADVGVWRPTDLLNGTVAKELAAVARAAWMGDRT